MSVKDETGKIYGRLQVLSLAVWCRELGIPYPRTYNRFVIKQESFEIAITPKRKPGIQPI